MAAAIQKKTESLQYWRDFFATANNSTIFDILDHAITVAASDFPEEFTRQRTRILDSIQRLGLGSDLGFCAGAASESTGSDQKAEQPSKPSLKIRIKIVKRNADGTLIEPSSDEAKLIKPCSHLIDQAPMPPCVGDQAKSIKPKPCLDEAAIEAKLQATKRKLHDRYQEIENNKRQRRIQVLNHLPNQDFKIRCPAKPKLGNHWKPVLKIRT
ncbi:hypothetical protein ABKV19_027225 [Rosa sericea]